jgi:hypothetical protein
MYARRFLRAAAYAAFGALDVALAVIATVALLPLTAAIIGGRTVVDRLLPPDGAA